MSENEKDEQQVWLSVRETAKRLNTTEEMVRRKIRADELPAQRLTDSPRAPWMINAVALERRLKIEEQKRRFHESGVVVGYSDQGGAADQAFVAEVGRRHGPEQAQDLRAYLDRRELLARVERDMYADPSARQQFERLDDEDRIKAEARELANRIRRAERIRDLALEILEKEDEQD